MRIVITGANGFVGAHLTRQLIHDHEVLAIDNLRYGPWCFSDQETSHFRCATADLRDRAKLAELVAEFDPHAIVHLAAIHFIPECERLPDEAVSINVRGSVNLLVACPPTCRFIYTSSAAVYGPKDAAHREDVDAIKPVDVYGLTKLHGEHFVRHFTAEKELDSVIVRLFNVIGPGETNPHVLPEIIKQLKAGSRSLRLGNVQPKRDYIYVTDVADGFKALATRPFPSHGRTDPHTVNLGSGKSYSVEELIGRLSGIIGEKISIEVDPLRVRKVDRPNLLADNSRIRELFSWSPKYDLDAALEHTWNNPNIRAGASDR